MFRFKQDNGNGSKLPMPVVILFIVFAGLMMVIDAIGTTVEFITRRWFFIVCTITVVAAMILWWQITH